MVVTRSEVTVWMTFFTSETQPTEVVLAVETDHVHAACILENVHFALGTLLGVVFLPLQVQFVYAPFDFGLPSFYSLTRDWLMSCKLALQTSDESTRARTVFAWKAVGFDVEGSLTRCHVHVASWV